MLVAFNSCSFSGTGDRERHRSFFSKQQERDRVLYGSLEAIQIDRERLAGRWERLPVACPSPMRIKVLVTSFFISKL